MSIIRVLSDHLANQIAAGEVVERPASVVKELLENALDAGADRINIQAEGDGTRLIRVMDNGSGMDQDDVLLSLERHATSKLTEERQLSAITTLGFRGEALPSIGSVSRMSILSRLHTAEMGSRAEVRYGTLHDFHDDGCACGTIIEVRNLFGNLPARKKFLKSKRTELFHIEEVIRNQALAHPDISFALEVDGRQTITLAAADSEQRVRDVFRYSGRLLDIARSGEPDAPTLRGFLLLPDAISTASLRILVNNRPVQDRMIRYAVAEGMKGLLMKGQQPAGTLLLDLDPQQIDINVHPAKREIRFRNPHEIRQFLVRAVSEAVLRHQEEVRCELFRPRHNEHHEHRRDESLCSPLQSGQAGQAQEPSSATCTEICTTASSLSSGYLGTTDHKPDRQAEQQIYTQQYSAEPLPFSSFSAGEGHEQDANRQEEREYQKEQQTEPQEYSGLRLIGQFLNLYLLCEHDGELVVI
ncbi:MAG: DNA mismatch repair endonuclease MutL, partial [Candidatus Electrothrix sp. AUS1_2]|nr:DNA mismatch repair endonuclease MutL [Candidatus Electrothrix sp. AUS1_2]